MAEPYSGSREGKILPAGRVGISFQGKTYTAAFRSKTARGRRKACP